jgi:crotonobetaine/carnitine-CoA ligase
MARLTGLPEEWRSWRVVPDRLRYWAREDPDRPFLRCGPDWLSYAEVDARTDALAGGFAGLGVAKGDRVAVVLPNRLEYLLTFFALTKLGAIQVPVNPYLKGEFLRHQLADAGAGTLVGDAPALAQLVQLRDRLPALRTAVAVGEIPNGEVPDAGPAPGGPVPAGPVPFDTVPFDTVPFAELAASDHPAPEVSIEPSDLLAVMYTSGTTGLPKGCMLTHGYYLAMPWPWFQNDWLRPGDRTLTAMPLFHIGGQGIALMPALLAGNSIAYLEEFSASGFIDQARDTQATVGFGVGPMGMATLASPPTERDREHSMRLGVWVPMPIPAQEAYAERFGVQVISETYGQTECNPITGSPIDRHPSKRASLGRPNQSLEVRLLDDDGREVPTGEAGEIVIRSREPDVMFAGYWNRDPDPGGADWHHTGDLARADADGYLYYLDRKKDAMRRRGENISSLEVEAAIVAHPKIAAVAVHAVPSPLGEDDVKACLVLAPGQDFEPAELHGFLSSVLPYFAVPRYVEFLDTLPLTPTGRMQKHLLRARDPAASDTASTWDFEQLGLTIAKADRR